MCVIAGQYRCVTVSQICLVNTGLMVVCRCLQAWPAVSDVGRYAARSTVADVATSDRVAFVA